MKSPSTTAHKQLDKSKMQEVVLSALRKHGPKTADELAALTGYDITSIRPRCTELMAATAIVKTGSFRPNKNNISTTVYQVKS